MKMKEKIEELSFFLDNRNIIAEWEKHGEPLLSLYPGCKLVMDVWPHEIPGYVFEICIIDFAVPEIVASCKSKSPHSYQYADTVTELIREYRDRLADELWDMSEDATFVEAKDYYKDNPDYTDDISLVSASEWEGFPAGLSVDSFWEWFNYHHTGEIEHFVG